MFSAIKNGGCFLNKSKCSVSSIHNLSNALLATGFPYQIRELKEDNNLLNFCTFRVFSQGVRRIGSAALDLAYVANGRLDGFWEQWLKPWDVAAGFLLVTEAGGCVSLYDGSEFSFEKQEIVASNKKIHQEMIHILQKPKPGILNFLYD